MHVRGIIVERLILGFGGVGRLAVGSVRRDEGGGVGLRVGVGRVHVGAGGNVDGQLKATAAKVVHQAAAEEEARRVRGDGHGVVDAVDCACIAVRTAVEVGAEADRLTAVVERAEHGVSVQLHGVVDADRLQESQGVAGDRSVGHDKVDAVALFRNELRIVEANLIFPQGGDQSLLGVRRGSRRNVLQVVEGHARRLRRAGLNAGVGVDRRRNGVAEGDRRLERARGARLVAADQASVLEVEGAAGAGAAAEDRTAVVVGQRLAAEIDPVAVEVAVDRGVVRMVLVGLVADRKARRGAVRGAVELVVLEQPDLAAGFGPGVRLRDRRADVVIGGLRAVGRSRLHDGALLDQIGVGNARGALELRDHPGVLGDLGSALRVGEVLPALRAGPVGAVAGARKGRGRGFVRLGIAVRADEHRDHPGVLGDLHRARGVGEVAAAGAGPVLGVAGGGVGRRGRGVMRRERRVIVRGKAEAGIILRGEVGGLDVSRRHPRDGARIGHRVVVGRGSLFHRNVVDGRRQRDRHGELGRSRVVCDVFAEEDRIGAVRGDGQGVRDALFRTAGAVVVPRGGIAVVFERADHAVAVGADEAVRAVGLEPRQRVAADRRAALDDMDGGTVLGDQLAVVHLDLVRPVSGGVDGVDRIVGARQGDQVRAVDDQARGVGAGGVAGSAGGGAGGHQTDVRAGAAGVLIDHRAVLDADARQAGAADHRVRALIGQRIAAEIQPDAVSRDALGNVLIAHVAVIQVGHRAGAGAVNDGVVAQQLEGAETARVGSCGSGSGGLRVIIVHIGTVALVPAHHVAGGNGARVVLRDGDDKISCLDFRRCGGIREVLGAGVALPVLRHTGRNVGHGDGFMVREARVRAFGRNADDGIVRRIQIVGLSAARRRSGDRARVGQRDGRHAGAGITVGRGQLKAGGVAGIVVDRCERRAEDRAVRVRIDDQLQLGGVACVALRTGRVVVLNRRAAGGERAELAGAAHVDGACQRACTVQCRNGR